MVEAFWLLTQLPAAARQADFVGALRELGLVGAAAEADRLDLAHDKACAAVMAMLHHQGKLQIQHAAMNLLGGFAPCFRTAAASGFFDGMRRVDEWRFDEDATELETDAEATDKLKELLKTTAQAVAQDLLVAWTAFGSFSRGCSGVELETLLAGSGFPDGLATSITESLSIHPDLEPRDEQASQLVEALSRAWNTRFGLD